MRGEKQLLELLSDLGVIYRYTSIQGLKKNPKGNMSPFWYGFSNNKKEHSCAIYTIKTRFRIGFKYCISEKYWGGGGESHIGLANLLIFVDFLTIPSPKDNSLKNLNLLLFNVFLPFFFFFRR